MILPNIFEITKKRYFQFFAKHDNDKGIICIKKKVNEGMEVTKCVKGKVICKVEWIRFTERQKVPMFEEWDETVKEKLP